MSDRLAIGASGVKYVRIIWVIMNLIELSHYLNTCSMLSHAYKESLIYADAVRPELYDAL